MTTQPGSTGSGRGDDADGRARDEGAVGQGRGVSRDAGRGVNRDANHGAGQDASRGGGTDITGEFQRWLIRSSARNMRRELTGQFRRALGREERAGRADSVWGVATTEPPPDPAADAPECAWCPVCRAARRIRKGPGVSVNLAGAGDAVAAAVQEALAAFAAAASGRPPGAGPPGFPADQFPADRFPADRFPAAGTRPEGADREPDDRG